jgi:hypothetical protein
MRAASAQNERDIQGGENSGRTEPEKKNDRAIDRAYPIKSFRMKKKI